jgi:hypothetical protein
MASAAVRLVRIKQAGSQCAGINRSEVEDERAGSHGQ